MNKSYICTEWKRERKQNQIKSSEIFNCQNQMQFCVICVNLYWLLCCLHFNSMSITQHQTDMIFIFGLSFIIVLSHGDLVHNFTVVNVKGFKSAADSTTGQRPVKMGRADNGANTIWVRNVCWRLDTFYSHDCSRNTLFNDLSNRK